MKRTLSIALLAAAVMLAGCPKKNTTVESPSQGSTVPGAQGEGAGAGGGTGTTPLEGGAAGAGGAAGQLGGPLAKHTVYFDFDKSEIKPEFADVITAHAKNLTSHPNLKMRLEGNTDERGTREYNIGLGERRAQAVRRALMLQGVSESQLTTVSYGAERPAAEGDDESAWAQNRRVDMVYLP